MTVETKKIRNLALISHGGAGKTTLTEKILLNSGEIEQAGSVEEGNSKSDFLNEEKKHKYSINNSYFSFSLQNKLLNLIDTPGYADFQAEVNSALRMVEGAVLLIDSEAGIEVNTNRVWEIAEENELSRFIFINKLDQEESEFNKVFSELQDNYDCTLLPVTIPAGEGENFKGVIDVMSEELIGEGTIDDISAESRENLENYKFELTESIVELDEELMMKYLEEEEISTEELKVALKKGVTSGEIVPVFSGSALNNIGVEVLTEYLLELTPAPDVRKTIKGIDGTEIDVDPESPFCALIGKTMVDPYIGKLSIFRVFSGTLKKGEEILVPRSKDKLKVSKIYRLNGAEQEQVEEITAGEIGAVAKMDELETSDTICSPEINIQLNEIDFPKPMLTMAAEPNGDSDGEKMSSALHRYSKEDPTFKVNYNRETKELLISGMGNIHLSVINDICQRKFDVGFITNTPSVAYKETIQTSVDVEERHKKQSGGRGQYGHVFLKIEPLPRGKDFEFDEEIFGGAIPNQYIPAVEKGIKESKDEGVLAGYPVVDFKVTVYDGSYHDVDSSEMAFKIASSKAFKKGLKQAKPVLLEPIMEVKVVVPKDYMGDIMGDLNSRRGKIMGMDPDDGKQIIKAQVPEGEMFSYVSDLKSITGGYGHFDMEFSHYAKVPGELQEEIIEQARQED
ncbi:MAG: elongation factor G [bacterium]